MAVLLRCELQTPTVFRIWRVTSASELAAIPLPEEGDRAYISADDAWVLRQDDEWISFVGGATLVQDGDPASPDDDTFWVAKEGTSPNMIISLKCRISGSTHTIASITV